MARLSRALTDSARVVRQVAAAARVEGASPMAETHGEWMPARLVPGQAFERDDESGRRAILARAELVCGVDALDVQPSDRIEVRSPLLGDATWSVTGIPQRAATGRAVVGVVVPLERTVEPSRVSVFA